MSCKEAWTSDSKLGYRLVCYHSEQDWVNLARKRHILDRSGTNRAFVHLYIFAASSPSISDVEMTWLQLWYCIITLQSRVVWSWWWWWRWGKKWWWWAESEWPTSRWEWLCWIIVMMMIKGRCLNAGKHHADSHWEEPWVTHTDSKTMSHHLIANKNVNWERILLSLRPSPHAELHHDCNWFANELWSWFHDGGDGDRSEWIIIKNGKRHFFVTKTFKWKKARGREEESRRKRGRKKTLTSQWVQ